MLKFARQCSSRAVTRSTINHAFKYSSCRTSVFTSLSNPARRVEQNVPIAHVHSSRQLQHGGHHHHHEVTEPEPVLPPERAAERERKMTQITLVGMASNVGLAVVKAAAGILGNSVAMIADAVHSVSDLLTDFVTLWVSKVSQKPADQHFPYGHGKFESLGALIISGLLVGTGLGIGWHSMENMQAIMSGKGIGTPSGIALVGAVISIAVKEAVYRATIKVGDEYDSKVIKANAWHHRSDAISSVVALVGVVGGMANLPIVDPIAGLFVSGLIVKAAAEIAWDSVKDLTDRSAPASVMQQVEKILESMKIEGVIGYHQLRGRTMGPVTLIDVHVCVDPLLSVTASHQIAEKVRIRIQQEMKSISEIFVHIDVADRPDLSMLSASDLQHLQDEEHNPDAKLMRAQSAIEADCARVWQSPEFSVIVGVTHFTCHFINNQLSVQMELVMSESLTISQAREVARKLDKAIRRSVKDVTAVDCHLELTASHIERAIAEASQAEQPNHSRRNL